MRAPGPQRLSHPQAEPTARSDNPEGEEGLRAQPAPCEMLVRGSGAAGPSPAWPMAPAGEHTAVVARQRPIEPFEAITAQECHREFATCSPDWHWAGAVAAMKWTGPGPQL